MKAKVLIRYVLETKTFDVWADISSDSGKFEMLGVGRYTLKESAMMVRNSIESLLAQIGYSVDITHGIIES